MKGVVPHMSIKTQKSIIFIPLINFFLMFVWLRFMSKNNIPAKEFVKKWIVVVIAFIAIMILKTIIITFFGIEGFLQNFLDYLSIYIIMVIIAFVSVKSQEDYINKMQM